MKIPLNLKAKRLYLAGFTGTYDQGEPVWGDPSDLYHQLFIGDHLGDIVLDYADGSSVRYPLIYGYSAWWYQPMEVAPEPFASSKSARRILEDALAIRATGSGPPGAYMGIIVPRPSLIRDFRIEDNPDKAGVPLIAALTIETNGTPPSKTVRQPHDRPTARQASWLATHRLQPGAGRIRAVKEGLSKERELLYTTKRSLSYHLPTSIPAGYRGPRVRFRGNVYADILTSIFYNDVQDILDKVDPNGMYHTSTKGAPSWGYYTGIGTWAKHVGSYYGQSWSRDLGRSLQEITELGFLSKASACANYCFQEAWRWQDDPTLKYDGVQLPAHWCRVINMPSPKLGDGVFENDGQGLIMLFTYKLWQREPHPNRWLHKHWPDVKAAGDWIGWQLDHPAISGASDVLRTDSECAGGIGNAKYADFLCEEALRAYATMADSIGHDNTGTRWERTADHLLSGIEKSYFTTDKWGPNWTLLPAGWPNKSTNLGPLIILADRRGFAPNDNLPGWRIRDLNAFRRLVSSYRPFGFYGVAMGYGQGFVTQAALLLDQMRDATTMLNWLAKAIYYPGYKPYITPEGCEVDPRGRFWHRTGDLGNGVQEGETVKVLRLVIGVDDDNPNRDQLIPRLPTGWDEISVSSYPMLTDIGPGRRAVRRIEYRLQRKGRTMSLHFQADSPIQRLDVRLGPFSEPITRLMVNGHPVAVNSVESGDSNWVWLPPMRSVSKFKVEALGK
ncbi:MAG: hypothetical protein M1330_01975 [Armatimonadetes bacterium]|nr:hypothetical protein [Armatimonadota bacterium]